MFIDDNFIADPDFARRLVRAFQPLGLIWHTAVSADILDHPDILDLMAESGCQSLFIGFESLNDASLCEAGKRQNHTDTYARLIGAIHRRGMMVNASVVFGFDSDTPGVFDATTEWLISQKIETMTAHILTPYPGTKLHARLTAEGRIFDHNLRHYNTSRAVFRPKLMRAKDLDEGYLRAYRTFYAWPNILRRMPLDRRATPYLLFNLFYRKFGKATAAIISSGGMRTLGRLGTKLSYSPWRPLSPNPPCTSPRVEARARSRQGA